MCKHDDRFVRGYRTIYFIIKSKETNYSFYKLLHALMSFSTHHRPDIVEDMSASTKQNLFYPLTLSCASTMTGLWGYRSIYFIIKSKETNYSFYKLLHALMNFSTHHRPDIGEDMSASTKQNQTKANVFFPNNSTDIIVIKIKCSRDANNSSFPVILSPLSPWHFFCVMVFPNAGISLTS